ncbi:MAG: hypothetical protein NVSMB38_14660 [Ktedonobacteraceae bacterium]
MQQDEQRQPEQIGLHQTTKQGAEPRDTNSSTLLEQQLAAEQQKAQAYLDMLRRTQADFVNYKRRVSQKQTEGHVAAQRTLLETLLPVLDDLGRALESVPPDVAQHPWTQGILLTAKRLTETLHQLGVRQVGAPGERFDPRWHEALMTELRLDVPEGTILRVTRPGYALEDRIIRPAHVIVAHAPEKTAP